MGANLQNCRIITVRHVIVVSLLTIFSLAYCLYAGCATESIPYSYLVKWMKQIVASKLEVLLTELTQRRLAKEKGVSVFL